MTTFWYRFLMVLSKKWDKSIRAVFRLLKNVTTANNQVYSWIFFRKIGTTFIWNLRFQGHLCAKLKTSLFAHDNRLRFLDYSRMSQLPIIKFILEYFSGKLARHSFEICGFKVIFVQNWRQVYSRTITVCDF